MAKVILLCGKIASGKTTFANKLKENGHTVILSVDELMLSLFDGCLGEKHNETVAKCLHYLCGLACELVLMNLDVVLDNGFWYKEERSRVRAYFEQRGIEAERYYFKTEDTVRIERLQKRNVELAGAKERVYIIGEELRQRLDLKFEEPDQNEGYRIIEV